MDPFFLMPPDTLLVEENGVVSGVTPEFYEEHLGEHDWTIVAVADAGWQPEGGKVKPTL